MSAGVLPSIKIHGRGVGVLRLVAGKLRVIQRIARVSHYAVQRCLAASDSTGICTRSKLHRLGVACEVRCRRHRERLKVAGIRLAMSTGKLGYRASR
jgi:DUF971 family protein